jgi:hypothetical protein
MKMNGWNWLLVVIAAVVVALFAVQAPEIARYVRIKRM